MFDKCHWHHDRKAWDIFSIWSVFSGLWTFLPPLTFLWISSSWKGGGVCLSFGQNQRGFCERQGLQLLVGVDVVAELIFMTSWYWLFAFVVDVELFFNFLNLTIFSRRSWFPSHRCYFDSPPLQLRNTGTGNWEEELKLLFREEELKRPNVLYEAKVWLVRKEKCSARFWKRCC